MTLIQLIVFTTIAVALQHLLYKWEIVTGPSWYHNLRYQKAVWKYWSVFVILWVALILSEEITYIIGLRLYG